MSASELLTDAELKSLVEALSDCWCDGRDVYAPVVAAVEHIVGERAAVKRVSTELDDLPSAPAGSAWVILFRTGGKYYTVEPWIIPERAIGPYDMDRSPDFRRIGGGPVLVPSQEPWGFPHLLMSGGDR